MCMINLMKKVTYFLTVAMLTFGIGLTSCTTETDDLVNNDITLEDAKIEGNVIVITFCLDGVNYDVVFQKVGEEYVLIDYTLTRANDNSTAYVYMIEEDTSNNQLKVYVREKDSNDLVLTLVVDFNTSTIEIIPGNSQINVSSIRMKIADVDITSQLKTKTISLSDALVKGATVVISYKSNDNKEPTVFTFTNNDGTFACKIEGYEAEYFRGSLTSSGNTLVFAADHWLDSYSNLKITFNLTDNTYKFMTVYHDYYNSHTVSVNGTDITSSLTKTN